MADDSPLEPLCPARPDWGRVGVLDAQSAAYGLPLAQLEWEGAPPTGAAVAGFGEALGAWAAERQVVLVRCTLPAPDGAALLAAQALGFRLVDVRLVASHHRLSARSFSAVRALLRRAEPADHARVEALAEHALTTGPYSADPRFPREREARHLRRRVAEALRAGDPASRVYVMGAPGDVDGVFHALLREGRAEVQLAAVEPLADPGLAGFGLVNASLHALVLEGARQLLAELSAVNTPLLNLYAALGFRFSDARAHLHWHAPGALP